MKLPTNGSARLGVYASVFMAFVTVLVAFVWVGDIASQVKQSASATAALAKRVDALDTDAKEIALNTAKLARDMREVETQFCAMVQYENKEHSADLRGFAALYEHVMKERYPTDNAYYRECNRPPE